MHVYMFHIIRDRWQSFQSGKVSFYHRIIEVTVLGVWNSTGHSRTRGQQMPIRTVAAKKYNYITRNKPPPTITSNSHIYIHIKHNSAAFHRFVSYHTDLGLYKQKQILSWHRPTERIYRTGIISENRLMMLLFSQRTRPWYLSMEHVWLTF